MKFAVPVRKVLRLPRALKVLKVLCRHEICSSSAQSAAPATKPATGGAQSAVPVTKSARPVRKRPLLPRNLLLEPATKSAHPDSHRAALPRRFAVACAALCARIFCFDANELSV